MDNQDEKKGFVIYNDYLQHLELMDMEQRGVFITALLRYSSGLELPEMDGMVKMAFSFAKAQMDRNDNKYQKTSQSRQESGRRGGIASGKKRASKNEANEANASVASKNEANEANKDTDTDTVTVTDTGTDTVTDTETGTGNNKNILADARDLFERLWRLYPNKKGKGQVSDTQKKRLLAIGEAELVKAIERYSSELQKDAGWRKPQNGSTFFNSGYVDYLDDNFVPSEEKPKSTGNAYIDAINNRMSVVDEWYAKYAGEEESG